MTGSVRQSKHQQAQQAQQEAEVQQRQQQMMANVFYSGFFTHPSFCECSTKVGIAVRVNSGGTSGTLTVAWMFSGQQTETIQLVHRSGSKVLMKDAKMQLDGEVGADGVVTGVLSLSLGGQRGGRFELRPQAVI
eukprot:COSAG06_NODE_21700_length_748_cov_1.114022_2_plen_133_part_01